MCELVVPNEWYLCDCGCHDPKQVILHCFPCCSTCRYCSNNVLTGKMDAHIANCHPELVDDYVKTIERSVSVFRFPYAGIGCLRSDGTFSWDPKTIDPEGLVRIYSIAGMKIKPIAEMVEYLKANNIKPTPAYSILGPLSADLLDDIKDLPDVTLKSDDD